MKRHFTALAFLLATGTHAYAQAYIANATIEYDEAAFYARHTAPTEVIDFTTLKDGTTLANFNMSNPFWTGHSISNTEFLIGEMNRPGF